MAGIRTWSPLALSVTCSTQISSKTCVIISWNSLDLNKIRASSQKLAFGVGSSWSQSRGATFKVENLNLDYHCCKMLFQVGHTGAQNKNEVNKVRARDCCSTASQPTILLLWSLHPLINDVSNSPSTSIFLCPKGFFFISKSNQVHKNGSCVLHRIIKLSPHPLQPTSRQHR